MAIRSLQEFNTLRNELPVILLPVVDDIVVVCSALVKLHNTLVI